MINLKELGASGDRENTKLETKKLEMPPFRDQLEKEM